MSRLSLFDDVVAHICWNYAHGNYDEDTNEKIYYAITEIVQKEELPIFLLEIMNRTGYAKSILAGNMSESTYKKKKKAIRDNIIKKLECNNEKHYERPISVSFK